MKKSVCKGVRKLDGRYVVGFLVEHDGKTYIYYENCKIMPEGVDTWIEHSEVFPESVAMFSGKVDKNGGYIFVNDIVEYETAMSKVMCIVSHASQNRVAIIPTSGIKSGEPILIDKIKDDQLCIIGNVYFGLSPRKGARND